MKLNRQFLIALTLLVSLLLTACVAGATATDAPTTAPPTDSGADSPASSNLPLVDEQGAVTVTITPLNLDNPGGTLDFDVGLETHSVELDMDLSTLATLTTDTGRSVNASIWSGPSGGHHVEGTLSFPATLDGTSLLEGTATLTLVLRDVDAPERRFVWTLGS